MDVFYEQLYKKKKNLSMRLLQIAVIAVAFILAVVIFMFFSIFGVGQLLGFLAVVGLAYGAYRLNMLFDVEYEYIYLNGEIDFDQIIAKNSRKRLITIKPDKIENYGIYDEKSKSHTENANIKKTFNFDSGNGNTLYYIIINHKEFGKTLVIFEPEEKIRQDFEKRIQKQW